MFLWFLERRDTVLQPVTPYGCANLSKSGTENSVTHDTHHRLLTSEVGVAGWCSAQCGGCFRGRLTHTCCLTPFKRQHHPEVPMPVRSQHQTCDRNLP